MFDRYNRKINYLRISVTDRCNLRCAYCMPEQGINLLEHEEILSFEEIRDFTSVAVHKGIDKVRVTGGEPLVRKGIVDLVEMLAGIKGIRDLAMTTNGVLLDRYAKPLAKAGLDRVNVSLDSMDAGRYREITRRGNLGDVLKGIDAALDAGLTPVKLNCVIRESPAEKDAREVTAYAAEKGLEVRFIREMSLSRGAFHQVIGGEGGNCITCNRLRLTADGKLKPCLFSDIEIDIRKKGYERAIELALKKKPLSGTRSLSGHFSNIGG